MAPGTQPGGFPLYYPTMPSGTSEVPMNYPAYQGLPNIYLPNANPYGAPMGVPLFPLYGYDNSAELDKDAEYMKQLYPRTAKSILAEIGSECDQMEYDGSVMFDEYPDKVYLERIIDRIYEHVRNIDEDNSTVEASSLYLYPEKHNKNFLRDIVGKLLLNEMFHRRRRHRSRRRWF
jgi:hypothetical protein